MAGGHHGLHRDRLLGQDQGSGGGQGPQPTIPGLGILHSNDYSSLAPGYWVLWSGQYDTSNQATKASKDLQSQAPGAYPKQVKP